MAEPRLTRAAAREATDLIADQVTDPSVHDVVAEKARNAFASRENQEESARKSVTKSKSKKSSKKDDEKSGRKKRKKKKRSAVRDKIAGRTKAKPRTETETKKLGPKLKLVSKRSEDPKPVLEGTGPEDLPHNLGSIPVPIPKRSSATSDKENQDTTESLQPDDYAADESIIGDIDQDTAKNEPKPPSKAKSSAGNYRLTPGISPFPKWQHPTPMECEVIKLLLSKVHGDIVAPKTIPAPSLTVAGCGEVPSVLDALIRTLLSAATTSANSSRAFNGLVQRFGILEEGIGKGSVNWDAVRQASLEDVFKAIESGGLANNKSKNLKAILDLVHADNQERRKALLSKKSTASVSESTVPESSTAKTEGENDYEIACTDQNVLSLNHLHGVSSEEAMTELTKYPGIGPKTAACVILFCLQRPCFAVDTHIFRLCKWLGWIPSTTTSEVMAFKHLEVRIPDHLKYSLHQLFIRHGRTCPRCRAITGESSAGWEEGCAIDHLVKRTGKRKGGKGKGTKRPAKRRKTGTRASATAKNRKIVSGEKNGEIEEIEYKAQAEDEVGGYSDFTEQSDTLLDGVSD
ncbi:DNA glycosylase [Penicillium angulare]|uniref:DNA glycosylase n=1 Tax=Penicillium angulare TaxID=116970 RepID=A0A9W9KC27_9EURO|nr:DNA glycosylase [Penicillium angulare]